VSDLTRRAWVEQVMGLPVSVHLRGPDLAAAQPLVADLYAELRRVDAVFSTYREDSELSRWERGELDLAEADPTLAAVMELCEQARRRTRGWFDARALPDPRSGQPRYDPSGLVKGWATQLAGRHLSTLDGCGWYLNAGGDIVAHAPADQPPWRVGVEDPFEPSRLLTVVSGRDIAVATSGPTHRGAHIVDPYRRAPSSAVRAVTVLGPELLWADVYATAAAACGPPALDWLADEDGYEALLVDPSARVWATEGWPTVSPSLGDQGRNRGV
jgi:FAD:protein FMN transferase